MDDPKLEPQEYLLRLQALLDRNTLPLNYTLDGWALKWAITTILNPPIEKKPDEKPLEEPTPHRVSDYSTWDGGIDY